MKLAIAAAAIALMIPAIASAEPQTWNVKSDIAGIQFTLKCNLDIADGKLSGPCINSMDGKPVQATGTYTDTTSEFSYDTEYQGSPIKVTYKGQMQSDGTVKGTMEAGGAEGTFTGAPGS